MTMEICPDCCGSGVANANADPCWKCNGSGGVPVCEAPAVTALRRQPRLSDLIDRADDLRKREKGE